MQDRRLFRCSWALAPPMALIDALSAGTIAGAGLDVTDPEPMRADDPLLARRRLVEAHGTGEDQNAAYL